jgi:hypothetical protein
MRRPQHYEGMSNTNTRRLSYGIPIDHPRFPDDQMDLGHHNTLVISPFPFSISLVATAAGAASAWSYWRLFLGSLFALAFIPGHFLAYAGGHGMDGVLISTPLLAPSWCVGLGFLLVHPLLAKGHHW